MYRSSGVPISASQAYSSFPMSISFPFPLAGKQHKKSQNIRAQIKKEYIYIYVYESVIQVVEELTECSVRIIMVIATFSASCLSIRGCQDIKHSTRS